MTTYSITLDDVDLALLPLPSCSSNKFLKKEMYEFQVMKTGSGEGPEPTILYTCHLCAIEVPAAFVSEHVASRKHQANVRIACVAAERMRAFISAPLQPYALQTSARFCTYCTTETNEEHEKTNEHRVAVMLDNLLWDLMEAYVKDHETKHHEMPSNESNKKGKINDEKYDYGNSKYMSNMAINNNEPTKLIEDKGEQEGKQIEKNSETNHNLEKSSNNNVTVNNTDNINLSTNQTENVKPILKSDNKHYGKELHKFINDQDMFEYKEIVKISIKFNDNIINNIDSDHYHSYERNCEEGNIKCILCDCVLNDEDAEAHKYKSEHMRMVSNLGTDGHYIREINKFYSHCILCNLKIENINLVTHTQSATHSVKEYLYTNTRSGNLKDRRDENNIKLAENNEIEKPNEYLENLRGKENPNHGYNTENEELNDNGNDYSEIKKLYDTLEEYSVTDESSDDQEEYDENNESNMSIYEHIENGDPITYLQYLEQYCKCEESITSIDDDDDECDDSGHLIDTQNDSLKEFSENQNPNDDRSEYLINQEPDLDECYANDNLSELSNNVFLKEFCENKDTKDKLDDCNRNEEVGDNLDKCTQTEELNDNLETYSKNDKLDLDEYIIEEPDNNVNNLYELSENEKLKGKLEICNDDEESNMLTQGESSYLRVTIDDSSEKISENGEPVTYLQYLKQLCKNEDSSMSIHEDSTYFIDDSSEDSSINEDSYDEEFSDNSEDNIVTEENNDKVEKPNEGIKITNDNIDCTPCTNEFKAKRQSQGNTAGKNKATNISVDSQKNEIKFPFEKLTLTAFGLVRCVICKRYLSINKMKQHTKGIRHRRMIKKKHSTTKPKEENTESIQEKSKQDIRKLNIDDSQKYGELLRKYIDDDDFFEFEETFITVEIKTQDNILKTYSDRFHSYNRFTDEGTIKCLVCDCTFKDEEDQAHKYDLNHICKIVNLGKDDHYIREINETYSHCILCNLKIENTNLDAHKDMFSHKFGKRLFTRSATKRNNEDISTAKGDTVTQHSSPVTDQIIKNCESNCDTDNNNRDQEFKIETSQINNTSTDNPINRECNKATDQKDFNTNNDIKEENSKLVDLTCAVKKETDEYIVYENNIKDYGDELRKLIDTKRDFEFNERGNFIRIKMDDQIISIYNDHFHSFDRTYYSRRLKCIVCDCILNFEDAEEHKYDLKHMSRIINLGHDQHYVRKIDESYSHCILCNLKIKNENLHSHQRLLLHTIKQDLYTSNTDDIYSLEVTTPKSKNEILGDREINTANHDKALHVDRVSNEKNENNETAAAVKPINIIVGTKTEYPYEITDNGNLRCVVCECQVPNNVWNKEEHVTGLRHRNMVWYRYA